jgi:hypothetical protein
MLLQERFQHFRRHQLVLCISKELTPKLAHEDLLVIAQVEEFEPLLINRLR